MSHIENVKQSNGGDFAPLPLQPDLALDAESEKRLHGLLNLLPAAVYTTDAAGRITFFNETAAALWGRRPTLNVDRWGGSWRMYWPDGTPLPHDQCPMAVVLKEGLAVSGLEAVVERPDGTRVPFMAFPSPLRDTTGAIVGAVNMFVDITERKRNEEMAQQLASIVESSNDAIVSKDLDGRITSWNRGAERLFGYTAEDIIGEPITRLIPPDRQDEEVEIIDRVRRGQRTEHYETVRRRKDGCLIEISLTVSPIKNALGKIVGASKIARDITERKRAEEASRRAEQEFRDFVDSASVGMHSVGPDGIILWANRTEMDMLGFAHEEYVGRHIAEFHADKPVIESILRRLTNRR